MNKFASAAKYVSNMTVTENGHVAASSTGDCLLDLYGQVGALRYREWENGVLPLVKRAIAEDELLFAKLMFYARDIRGGVGERDIFRNMLKYAAVNHPEIVRPNVSYIPYYGRWDDMYALIGTPAEDQMWDVIRKRFRADILALETPDKPVSLLGKWLKSCNTSSEESRALGKLTAKKLGFSEKNYRKYLTALRARIKVVEVNMSANNWDDICYSQVPSRAGLIYKEAFRRHDKERYDDYIASVLRGENKINAATNTPQDLIHTYMSSNIHFREEDPTIEAMWKNLPDYVDSDENVLCMVDVSGSMMGRPIEVSTGLGIYFAQHNRGAFHNLFMTFTKVPAFVSLNDADSLLENLRTTMKAPWGMNTDLDLACKELLKFAVSNHVPDSDMPRRLIIISDMEIDEATRGYGYTSLDKTSILHANALKRMYEETSYTMPQIIYWNVEARDNHFQTKSDIPGTMLASGSSPAVFEALIKMEDLQITPLDAMLAVLNSDRYSPISIE